MREQRYKTCGVNLGVLNLTVALSQRDVAEDATIQLSSVRINVD